MMSAMVDHDASGGGARLPWNVLQEESAAIRRSLGGVLSLVPAPVFVVNRFLQTVYVNDAFLRRFGEEADETLGARVGEMLHCPASATSLSGCATSLACPCCDFLRALVRAFNESAGTARAPFTRRESHVSDHWGVSPFRTGGESFAVCVLQP